jgi:hypothetical protein
MIIYIAKSYGRSSMAHSSTVEVLGVERVGVLG